MLVKKTLQLKLSAAHSSRIPAGEGQGFTPIRSPSLAAIIGKEQNNGLHDNSLTGCPCGEVDGREQPTSQPHTCFEVNANEIITFLEWGVESLNGDHQVACCGIVVLTFVTAFFLGFPAASVVVAMDLCSGFLLLATFLVGST